MFWPDMKALMQVVNPSPFAHLGPESDDVRFDRIPKIGENLKLRVSRLSSQGTEIKVIVPVVEGLTRAKIFRYYLPTDGDLALCRNLFPNSVDPGDPPWLQIEAELVLSRIPSTEFQQDTALMLLERLKASRKPPDQEPTAVGKGMSVADAPPDGEQQPPKVDGPLKPDGFRLNGIEVLGLVKDWQKTLTFVWERSADPPKWSDVTTHLGLQGTMTESRFAKFIYKINLHVKEWWKETLQTVEGDVVLRVPLPPKSRKSPGSQAKTNSAKKPSRNTTRKSTTTAAGKSPSKRKTRAIRK